MSRIIRFSPEEKVKIVEKYLSGKTGRNLLLSHYELSWSTLRDWVRLYQTRGQEGLVPAVKNRKYSNEVKINAVQDCLSGTGSIADTCIKYDITQTSMLRRWILCYNGHREFRQPKEGSVNYMTKGRTTTLNERIEIVGYCISNNKDYGKTIKRYNISYQQIYSWVKRYEISGTDGLIDRRGNRKDEHSMTEVEKLQAQIKLKEAENLRLQMENELLKKLEALERGQNID